MEQKDPSELVREVKEEQRRRGDIASEALAWFLDGRIGSFYPRQDAVEELSESLDISQTAADTAIADTVGDVVDPVQQIVRSGERFVGVIDYRVYESEGAYGYVDFDDRKGKRNRVVCARCVEKYDYDEQIRHATQGEGSLSPDATWQDLLNAVTSHYADSHAHPPSDIEPGASLVSGTTIGGNTAFHTGNLADRGAVTITPSTTNQTIPEGFHNGNGFVEGDADLIADNIRDGVNIFGVTGNVSFIPGSVASRPTDNQQTTATGESGLIIETKSEWQSIGARLSDNTDRYTTAYLRNSDQSLIQSVDISDVPLGGTFTFDGVNLGANSEYLITIDNGGSEYDVGFAFGDNDYPYTSTFVDIIDERFDGSSGQAVNSVNDIGDTGF